MLIKNIIKQYIQQLSNGIKNAYLSGYFRDSISKQHNLHYAKGNNGYFS